MLVWASVVWLTGVSCALSDIGYRQLEQTSLTDCTSICGHDDRCKSILFDHRLLQCHFYNLSLTDADSSPGTILRAKSNQVTDPCTGFSCRCDLSTCAVCRHCDVNPRTAAPFCVVDILACLSEPTVENGTVDTDGNCLVGATKIYTCNPGHYSDTEYITCSTDTTWTPGTCLQESLTPCGEEGFTRIGGICIKIYRNNSNGETASRTCKENGYRLVKIDNERTSTAIKQLILTNKDLTASNYYIGGRWSSAEQKFVWEDGTALEFTDWQEGYPKKRIAEQRCVILKKAFDFKWKHNICLAKLWVICEFKNMN